MGSCLPLQHYLVLLSPSITLLKHIGIITHDELFHTLGLLFLLFHFSGSLLSLFAWAALLFIMPHLRKSHPNYPTKVSFNYQPIYLASHNPIFPICYKTKQTFIIFCLLGYFPLLWNVISMSPKTYSSLIHVSLVPNRMSGTLLMLKKCLMSK